jgi:hypothetical protein
MGSVAEAVTQKATCPVVTVKEPLTEPPAASEFVPEEAEVVL